MAEGDTYTDVETSYDTAFDRLVADAFPSSEQGWGDWISGVVGLDNASVAEEAFSQGEEFINTNMELGGYIERRLGDDLAALQQPGREAEYQALVDYVREARPSNQEELLSVYQKVASPETFTAMVLAQAGVSEANIQTFVQRLSTEEAVRDNLYGFIESLGTQPGISGDIESLTERIQANSTLFQAMVDNPDGFFQLAGSPAFDSVITRVTEHIEGGGSLDQQGMMDLVSSISLEDKATMFLQMGGASAEEITQFQETLNRALEINPALEGILDTAIANSIRDGATSGSNVFETLASSSEIFATFATSEAARNLLTSPNLINSIVEQAAERGDEVTLSDLRDAGIESTVYHEAGLLAAVNGSTVSTSTLMFGGYGIDMMIDHAKRMGDGTSADFMQNLITQFQGILGGEGLGGIIGGLGNTPGFLQEAGALTASRFGVDLGGSSEMFARLDQSYVFDGSSETHRRLGYLTVDYEQIGRNLAENRWDAEGNVRAPAEDPVVETAGVAPPADRVGPT